MDMSNDYVERLITYVSKTIGTAPVVKRLESNDTIMAYLQAGEGYTIVNSWCSRLESARYYSMPLKFEHSMLLTYRADIPLSETAKRYLSGF